MTSASEVYRKYGALREVPKSAGDKPFRGIADVTGTVTNSAEYQRIAALPRRVLDLSQVEDVTPLFQKPGGTMHFRPIQSAALIEAALYNGLFGPIPCGKGKTLLALALPEALDSDRTVILVPPKLKRQLEREIDQVYGKHFNLPLDRITILSYSELSSPKRGSDVLHEIVPDLIVADEAHNLRNPRSARGKRFREFMKDYPHCRFVPLSGTMTRSVLEAGPLCELAIRKMSPYPRGYRELKDWAGALDTRPEYVMKPGILRKLLVESDGGDVRKAFARWRDETPGVISLFGPDDVGASLIVRRVELALPPEIKKYVDEVKKKWSIGGDEFSAATTKASVLRQLACGFYYRWAWPGGQVDEEWMRARREWLGAVNERLKRYERGMDTPHLLEMAAERFFQGKRSGKVWDAPEYEVWREQKHKKPPPTETVWLHDFLVEDALERAEKWAKDKDDPHNTIVWYRHRAVGKRLGEVSGLMVYGEGTDLTGTRHAVAVASAFVQSEGRNVQDWYSGNVITSPPGSGGALEQLLSRTHREGQVADEVLVDFYGHTEETLASMSLAVEQAEGQQAMGYSQKIFLGTRLNW